MNDYVGKICPVCKQEINEFDKVTVCVDCGIAHHTACWENNSGCSTFGCAQQGSAKKKKQITTCSKCGVVLEDGQEFCPKCGTPKNSLMKNKCGKCGNELAEGQDFCPKCGQKVGTVVDNNVSYGINQFNASVAQPAAKKKKTPIVIATAVVIVGLLVAVGIKFAPKIIGGGLFNIDSYTRVEVAADEVSQKMIEDINDLGEITLEDEEQIEKLMNRYATLTDAQKASVSNYSVLLDAQDEIDNIKKGLTEQKEEYLAIERKYYDEIEHGLRVLKDWLTNPTSLEVKEIYFARTYVKVDTYEEAYTHVLIFYSSQNGFGNSVESVCEIVNMDNFPLQKALFESTVKTVVSGKSDECNIKIGDNFYSNTEDFNSKEAYFAFMVDLEDYKQNKTL